MTSPLGKKLVIAALVLGAGFGLAAAGAMTAFAAGPGSFMESAFFPRPAAAEASAALRAAAGLPAQQPSYDYRQASIVSASPRVFAYAHGIIQADGKFFVGMADASGNQFPPNRVTIFPDPSDLNRYSLVTLPDRGGVEDIDYDAKNDKIYLILADNGRLELYSLDPHTYALATIVSTSTIDAGRRPAIANDGTYIYGITNTDPSVVFKARIRDGALSYNAVGHIKNGHSASIGVYGSTTELYFGGGMSDGFEKTDAASLRPLATMSLAPCSLSNDQVYSAAGYVYVGCEMQPYGYRIRAADMSATKFPLPGRTFGLFSYGGDLYSASRDGAIDMFRDMRLDALRRYVVMNTSLVPDEPGQSLELNKLFFAPPAGISTPTGTSTTPSVFFTAWWGVPGLYRTALR